LSLQYSYAVKKPIDLPFDLFDYQEAALIKANTRSGFMYLMDMGLGKTITALEDSRQRGSKFTLCIAPAGVHVAWARDSVLKYYSKYYDYIAYYQRGDLRELTDKDIKECKNIFISVNYEILEKSHLLFFVKLIKMLKKTNSFLIIDECHRIKNRSAKITKTVMKLSDLFSYTRLLSGTPIGNGNQDLYSQLKIVMKDSLPFKSFSSFADMFCIYGGFKNKQIIGSKNSQTLKKMLDAWSFIAKKEDCIELPPKVYETKYLELSESGRELYRKAKKKTLEVAGKDMTQAINQLNMLRNLTSGLLDGRHIYSAYDENPKLCEVEKILEDHEGKSIIIFVSYVTEGLFLSNYLGVSFYHGELTSDEKEFVLELYKNGKEKILVATVQSLGTGFDLHMTNVIIYFSNQYSYLLRAQSEDRAHRIGTREPVTIYNLIVENTVDEKIYDCLLKKENIADKILKEGFKSFIN